MRDNTAVRRAQVARLRRVFADAQRERRALAAATLERRANDAERARALRFSSYGDTSGGMSALRASYAVKDVAAMAKSLGALCGALLWSR